MVPAFPAAVEIPWQVEQILAGKILSGAMKVVELGRRLAKKNVKEYMTTKPIRFSSI
ncbi:hypothetical protein Hanom_Chr09g00836341 [Helianthus anomalus]